MRKTPIRKAIEKAGSLDAFAKIAEVTPRAVHYWINADGIPPGRVPGIAAKLKMTMRELRPDIYKRNSK